MQTDTNTNRKKLILTKLSQINNYYHIGQTTEDNKFSELWYLFRNFCFRFAIISEFGSKWKWTSQSFITSLDLVLEILAKQLLTNVDALW